MTDHLSAAADPAGDAVVAVDAQRGFAQRFVDRVAGRLRAPKGRRSFLASTAVVGSALAVNPIRYLFRQGTAEEAVCGPANECSEGWTVFCCTINAGKNSCPPGSVAAGWWKADASPFCGGAARYYLDCNAVCSSACGCSGGICGPACHGFTCSCGQGSCDRRRIACNAFRYGQCHQELACVGPVVCRVVSCVPPWQWEPSCTAETATANATRFHHAPCLEGGVTAFGEALDHGRPSTAIPSPVTGMESTPAGDGYWLVTLSGSILAFGNAVDFGDAGPVPLNAAIVDLAATPAGDGYWLVAADGGIFTYGTASFFGSAGSIPLRANIVGMAATPSGLGYWLVARDGGVFTFGDARFHGSTGDLALNAPIVGMASTPTGLGYWLVARDGGVFAFGDAEFHGSAIGLARAVPIVGMAATPSGGGYWLVGLDGAVLTFGDAPFHGAVPSAAPDSAFGAAVDIESTPFGDGYWIASGQT